jgi:hypothetical protein
MEDETFTIQITSKGAVFGSGLYLTALQTAYVYSLDNKDNSLENFIEFLYTRIKKDLTRAGLNKDGTLSPDDAVELGKVKEATEHVYNLYRVGKNPSEDNE